jgi:hypothetical protein
MTEAMHAESIAHLARKRLVDTARERDRGAPLRLGPGLPPLLHGDHLAYMNIDRMNDAAAFGVQEVACLCGTKRVLKHERRAGAES